MSDGTPSTLLAYNIWLSLPRETRNKLVALFQIPKSGEVIVRIGAETDVQSDGHTPKDLYAITTEKMQEYLGSADTDFYKLFHSVLAKLDGKYSEPAPAKTKKHSKHEKS